MKERKILTKLGILFGVIDLLLILFGVIFLKPKQVLAETPDSFLMNEIYLYNRNTFNLNPNFENDYLMKSTILPSDVESDNTSGLLGWYKNLGYTSLIKPYYGDDDNLYVTFAIPLSGILAVNFQLAYNVSSPTLLDFYLLFDDGTRQEWDTEQTGFGSRILVIDNNNLNKNCYALCWEAYSPDYVPSFKFLGVTEGYNIGYQNGETTGFERGFNSGYNNGYNAGFQEGIENTEQVTYERTLLFNQQIRNGNFENLSYWSGVNLNVNDNTLTFSPIAQYQNFNQTISLVNNNIYYFSLKHKGVTGGFNIYINTPPSGFYLPGGLSDTNDNDFKTYKYYFKYTGSTGNYSIIFQDNRIASELTANQFKDIYLINLTQMYGEGYEPAQATANYMFFEYYPYNKEGTPLQMGYYTGYYEGKDEGISEGINIGESNQINMNWIQSLFQAMQGFFNIQVFPHVTLGIIVGIPFVISLAWFVIKMFRGGGGGED